MNIRKYSTADENKCIDVFISNCPKYFKFEEADDFKKWLRKFSNHYVLEKDGEIIGYGGFYIVEEKNHAGLAWGMINRNYHKKGYGKKLLEFRIKKIKELKKKIEIKINTSQHSYGFFLKFGFKVNNIAKDYYGQGLDKYEMNLLCN